jgi:hypothetical protein
MLGRWRKGELLSAIKRGLCVGCQCGAYTLKDARRAYGASDGEAHRRDVIGGSKVER